MSRRDKGFTMVELQVASAIMLMTLSAVFAMYLFSWRSFAAGSNLLDVYSNSRNASGWLTRDIRCAAQVVPSQGSYTTTDSSIVLMVPSIDALGEIISPCYDYIIYELRDAVQGKDMYRVVEKNPLSSRVSGDCVIAHYCSSLTFSSGGITLSNIGNLSEINTVSIYLPISKSTGTQTGSINPTTVVRLRNK